MRGKSALDVLLVLAALATLGAVGWAFIGYYFGGIGHGAEISLIRSRVIYSEVVHGSGPDALTTYTYRGGPLPAKLAPDEIVQLRSASSYTKLIDDPSAGAKDGKTTMQLISYSHPVFVQDSGSWYYLEYAQAPASVFESARTTLSSALEHLMGRAAYADTFSSAGGDGDVNESASTWLAAHSATFGGNTTSGTGAFIVGVGYAFVGKSNEYEIYRGFLPFDTSAIPGGANIKSASVNLYATTTSDQIVDGDDYLTLIAGTSQASSTSLTIFDFGKDGATTSPTEANDSSERVALGTMSTGVYTTIPLNATGLASIVKSGGASTCDSITGITCLGLREGHDTTNTAVPASAALDYASFAYSTEGAGNAPYLSVTYGGIPFGWWSDF